MALLPAAAAAGAHRDAGGTVANLVVLAAGQLHQKLADLWQRAGGCVGVVRGGEWRGERCGWKCWVKTAPRPSAQQLRHATALPARQTTF